MTHKKLSDDMQWEFSNHGWMGHSHHNLTECGTLLDNTGKGFCLAKWQQVTMHLGTGMTHSCHHPTAHNIPVAELENNPSALHNTEFKKEQRRKMLNGERPDECDYCWRMEDNDELSDRQFKSMEPWALPYHDDIIAKTGDENVFPSYLEVSFSNACNMKCTYCGPESSSKWVDDIKTHGPIKLLEGFEDEQWSHGWQPNIDTLNIKNNEHNPYTEAFWKWWPEASKHLKVFRITGGEPLMNKNTFSTMDWFIDNPNPDLEFNINSNLSVPDKLWDKFIERLVLLKDSDNIKKMTIYTSVDGWGKRAEYARTGLDFDLFKTRYEQLVSMGNIRCVIMCTYNIFSVTSYQKILEWQITLREKYNSNSSTLQYEDQGWVVTNDADDSNTHLKNKNHKHVSVVGLDTPYLRHPVFLDARIVTSDLVNEYQIPSLKYMSRNASEPFFWNHQGFEDYEIEKFRKIVLDRLFHINNTNSFQDEIGLPAQFKILDNNRVDDVIILRAKFYEYTLISDERNGTDFASTFPEMANFYRECKDSYELYRMTKGEEYNRELSCDEYVKVYGKMPMPIEENDNDTSADAGE